MTAVVSEGQQSLRAEWFPGGEGGSSSMAPRSRPALYLSRSS